MIFNPFRLFVKPTFYVLLGVLLTMLSALLTHKVIVENTARIETLTKESSQIEYLIEQMWDNLLMLDQRKDTALILYQTISFKQIDIVDYIRSSTKHIEKHVESFPEDPDASIAIAWMQRAIEMNRERVLMRINDKYYEKLEMENEAATIDSTNMRYSNIALFLQIMGLILVLSRDIIGRHY